VDAKAGIAFGAFFSEKMRFPAVSKLEGTTSVEAEIETLLLAVRNSEKCSQIMTDLSEIRHYMEAWADRDLIIQLRQALQKKQSSIKYCPPKWRPKLYHSCHRAARASMIEQRRKEANLALEELTRRNKKFKV